MHENNSFEDLVKETTREPIQSPREGVAVLGALLESVLPNLASVLSPEIVDAVQDELWTMPSFAVLSAHERDLWNACLSYNPPSSNYAGGSDTLIYGWLLTTFHQVHAAFSLEAQGLGEVAVVNVRTAMEHAIYLSALVGSGNVETILTSKAFRHIKGLRALLDGQTPELHAELVQILGPLIFGGDESSTPRWVENVQQICNRLNTGSKVYAQYRILSERMHPGISSAILPAAFNEPDLGCSRSPDLTGRVTTSNFVIRYTLWLAIGACAWAGWAADRLFGTDYFGPVLSDFAGELGFIPIFEETHSQAET